MRVFRGLSQPLPAPTVLTIGNFDGVHLGHRALLQQVREIAEAKSLVSTVLTFEPHPREFFSPDSAPARLSTLREKLELLAECGVQQVVVCPFNAAFASVSANDFIQKFLLDGMKCQHLVVGDDFRFGAARQGDFHLLSKIFNELSFVVESISQVLVSGQRVASSAIRSALAVGEMVQAAGFLGRPYRMDGRVMTGQRLGRTLGFPTANIFIRHSPLPLSGVFAVEVVGAGDANEIVNGVANLGIRPTVNGIRPILEVHLFDFEGDIYGRHLQVSFLKKLRTEQKFPNLDALKAQIACDALAAQTFFSSKAATGIHYG